jgi:membrane carboxypeptidase/penicillin-binding protein PbpC
MLAAVEHAGRDVHDAAAILERPGDVERREICLVSGMAAGAACRRRGVEWTRPGDGDRCTWHRETAGRLLTIWPDRYRRWAADEGLPTPAPTTASRASVPPMTGFRIVTPQRDAVYLIDPTLRPEFQTLALTTEGARGRVRWTINDQPAGTTTASAALDWPLRPGLHTVVATDDAGGVSRTVFRVK